MNIYLILDAVFLVVITILLVRDDSVNWLHIFTGIVMGLSLHELITFFRDRKRVKRNLRWGDIMKKFFRRIGKTGFLILFFIPFGVYGFCQRGWQGLFTSMLGYGIGWCLCANWSRIKSYPWKKFLRRHLKAIVKLIILVPIMSACTYYMGWRGLLASILGWIVGEFICWRFLSVRS